VVGHLKPQKPESQNSEVLFPHPFILFTFRKLLLCTIVWYLKPQNPEPGNPETLVTHLFPFRNLGIVCG